MGRSVKLVREDKVPNFTVGARDDTVVALQL